MGLESLNTKKTRELEPKNDIGEMKWKQNEKRAASLEGMRRI